MPTETKVTQNKRKRFCFLIKGISEIWLITIYFRNDNQKSKNVESITKF